jgi:tetratricopeptide (TPR) repeat protein
MKHLRSAALALFAVLSVTMAAQDAPVVDDVDLAGAEVAAEVTDALAAAKTAMMETRFEDAIAQYEKAAAALPANASLKIATAHAYYELGDVKKAIGLLSDVYKADKNNATAATRLATLLTEEGKMPEARKILEGVPLESITDPAPFTAIGIELMNKGKRDEAVAYFDKVVKIAPESFEGYYYRAQALMQLRKNDAAKADLLKAIELGGDSPEAADAKDLLAELQK